jgi:hypothetical protein
MMAIRTTESLESTPTRDGDSWLTFALFVAVLLGSLGMVVVVLGAAPSLGSFAYAMATDVGVYFAACVALAAVGSVLSFTAKGQQRRRWTSLAVAFALVAADGALSWRLAAPRKSAMNLMRYLPLLTPAHVILVLVVIRWCWRAPSGAGSEGSSSGP